MLARRSAVSDHGPDAPAVGSVPAKRPLAWSLRNWPVGWRVLAIALVPLTLSMVFGGWRIHAQVVHAGELRLAADRAEVVPAIAQYLSSLGIALLSDATGTDVAGAGKDYQAHKYALQARLADADVAPDVRSSVSTLLNGGQTLLDKVSDKSIGLRDQVTAYVPILLTAEDAVNASVPVDDNQIRAQTHGLSRAIGARGRMLMQQILVTKGADLPEEQLRTSMITLASTEPSTMLATGELLGVGSPDAKSLQQQMATRMAIMSDPTSDLVNNAELLRSIRSTDGIAERVIKDTAASVTKSVQDQAGAGRDAVIRDTITVLAAIVTALVIVSLVARSLVKPLRVLRDGALKVAHTDLESGIARVRAGDERGPQPLPIHTTEEIGQVAHAIDELHTQALLLAGDEARLRLLVNDMFETMSRRNRSLVDQQLSLIDRLERSEEDPDRLDSLFRLDHLAARLRRNSANLLVLAGAQISREQRGPVPLSTVINAAVSEVEDYRRVEIRMVPDCRVTGAAVGCVIQLLAELIDNALRYSPPTSLVRLSVARCADGGVLLEVIDSGLGMTEGDRRVANMRLCTGGEVAPDNARHMGLFVVGRLAQRHDIRVQLHGSATAGAGSGTTAEVYLPSAVFIDEPADDIRPPGVSGRGSAPAAFGCPGPFTGAAPTGVIDAPKSNGSATPVTLLPRRNPGASGITDVPAAVAEQPPASSRRALPRPWWEQHWEDGVEQAVGDPAAQLASDTRVAGDDAAVASAVQEPGSQLAGTAEEDLIYQRMLSELLVDPDELAQSADLDWQSVWDYGWSAAAEAESVTVRSHTDHGLPVREPGARLIPGAAAPQGSSRTAATRVFSEPDRSRRHGPDLAPAARDPDAIRASISSHFGGVRTARSHARGRNLGPSQQ